jgi:hypothetical protein
MIDLHTLDFLMLTETPILPYHGALTQVLGNRGCKIHCHQVNAPVPQGTLPEARLPSHTTHNGRVVGWHAKT